MSIYPQLLLVAAVTIFVVDISGFTESWRSALARMLHVPSLKRIKPFDCSLCMTWWVCLVYALVTGHLNLGTIAFSALLSHLSNPIGQVLIFIREWIIYIVNRLMP